MTPEQVNPVLDVHLRGAFYVTQPAWQRMRDQGYGRIVNTSSAAGIFGNFGQANYGAAKMGLVGFTRVLAVEGAKNNIKANAIAPVAKTRMTEELFGEAMDKLSPELVTPIVTYLAHEDCSVSGEVYSVGGGRVARIFVGVTPGHFDAGPLPRERARQLRRDPRRGGLRGAGQPQRRDDARLQVDGLERPGHGKGRLGRPPFCGRSRSPCSRQRPENRWCWVSGWPTRGRRRPAGRR